MDFGDVLPVDVLGDESVGAAVGPAGVGDAEPSVVVLIGDLGALVGQDDVILNVPFFGWWRFAVDRHVELEVRAGADLHVDHGLAVNTRRH